MKLITSDTINTLLAGAGANARRRINHNVHESFSDPVQKMFVAAKRDSYFRPHRHPSKSEFAIVIQGGFDILVFDDNAFVIERHAVGPESGVLGFEIPAGAWHTWLPTVDDAIFFEVKQGPYDARTAAEFATWSPAEGDENASGFMEHLRRLTVGDPAV